MKQDRNDIDYNFIAFLLISLSMGFFMISKVFAATAPKVAKEKCVVRLDNKTVARVAIGIDGTALEFPVKPTNVILGRKGSFGIEYVKSDLTVSPLSSVSKSNLFVYLEGRRFSFILYTVPSGECPVITVRDSKESQMQVSP